MATAWINKGRFCDIRGIHPFAWNIIVVGHNLSERMVPEAITHMTAWQITINYTYGNHSLPWFAKEGI